MLSRVKKRFTGFENISFIAGDYLNMDLPDNQDIVASALSIHHLESMEKKRLYRKIFSALKTGGIFINADQVIASSDEMENLYKKIWIEHIESGTLSQEGVSAAVSRMKMDKPSTLQENIDFFMRGRFDFN
jgi:tRNA (cmo5U34)-methyltransferase